MCPVCMATAATLVAGATSAGSVIAFMVGKQKGRGGATATDHASSQTGDNDATTENRDAR
jgi:hypothetical protein